MVGHGHLCVWWQTDEEFQIVLVVLCVALSMVSGWCSVTWKQPQEIRPLFVDIFETAFTPICSIRSHKSLDISEFKFYVPLLRPQPILILISTLNFNQLNRNDENWSSFSALNFKTNEKRSHTKFQLEFPIF